MTVLYCTVLYCTVPGISCPVYVGGDGCTLMVAISIVFVVIVGVILTVLWQARLHKIPIWSSNCPVSVSPTLVTRWLPRINTLYLVTSDTFSHHLIVRDTIDMSICKLISTSCLSEIFHDYPVWFLLIYCVKSPSGAHPAQPSCTVSYPVVINLKKLFRKVILATCVLTLCFYGLIEGYHCPIVCRKHLRHISTELSKKTSGAPALAHSDDPCISPLWTAGHCQQFPLNLSPCQVPRCNL